MNNEVNPENTPYKSNYKSAIARSFSRAAPTYDKAAILQKEIGDRLFERLDFIPIEPKRILDLGAGTGLFSRQLAQKYPNAEIIHCDIAEGMLNHAQSLVNSHSNLVLLCADGDHLPIQSQSIDFVFSNCTLQWFFNPVSIFQEIGRVLKSEGLFLFSTFGRDTLKELRYCFSELDENHHVNHFLDMHDIGDILVQLQFQSPVVDMENITITYPNLKTLISDLKQTGANQVTLKNANVLSPKNTFDQLAKQYEVFRSEDNYLPATFEIVYGHAFGILSHPATCTKNRIAILQVEE